MNVNGLFSFLYHYDDRMSGFDDDSDDKHS